MAKPRIQQQLARRPAAPRPAPARPNTAESGPPGNQWSCGCSNHRPDDGAFWEEPEFQAVLRWEMETADRLIRGLRQTRQPSLGPYPPIPATLGKIRLFEVRQYFSRLRRWLKSGDYRHQVDIYERAVKAFLALPLCKRGRGFPPYPTAVAGIASLDQLLTTRRGGRRPGRPIHERNVLIAALKGQGLTARAICAALDARHVPVPRTWRQHSWSREYASDRSARGRIDKLVSAVARQARIASQA